MTEWEQRFREALDAFRRGELDEAARYMADDIQWAPRLGAVDAAMLPGKAAVQRLWADQIEALGGPGTFSFDLLSFEELGPGTMLSELHASGTGTTSGITVEDHYWAVWSVRGGLVVRVDQYDTREDALADLTS